MRIGILSTCQFSMFSGGLANTTVALLETMKILGNDVYLLNTNNGVEWFDDCKLLTNTVKVINIEKDSGKCDEQFDLIIELTPYFDSESQRRIFSKKSVYLFRKGILIPTIEHSLYPVILQKYNFDGISEIWSFNLLSDSDEIQIMETLTRKPVFSLPYLWTPSIIEAHRTEHNMPIWYSVQAMIAQQNNGALPLWSPHICETNTTSASSCTIPMLIMRQAKANKFPVSKYKVHNTDQLLKSDFFKDNVKRHCEIQDLSGEFVGRQRMIDFVFEPMSCIISHVRFIPFKPMLFDLAWFGIPFIHNSEALNSISCFERYYYPNNKISVGVEKLGLMHEDFVGGRGWFSLENLQETRKKLLESFTPMNTSIIEAYKTRLDALHKVEAVKTPTEVVKTPTEVVNTPTEVVKTPTEVVNTPTEVVKTVTDEPLPELNVSESKRKYYIMFSDFWPDFNNSYNFFSLLIENTKKDLDVVCCGEAEMQHGVQPDAIVFSAFGETWKKYPNVPKIYYTGENTPPLSESSIKLNLGFGHADMVSDAYLRFPLWILEIDWFNCDKERISNPKPIPLEDCTNVNFNALSRKKKFCAFVVSNPNNPVRNLAFEWLYSYKPIDSGGRLFNTIGDSLFAGGGGGGGELKKFEFYKDYKFCLTYENSSSQGYVTEKVLHAKAAGCIPIYWGDPKIERDFNINGMIDARDIRTREELIAAVKAIDENDEEYIKKYSIPALDSYRVDWARRTMAELASRILKIATTNKVDVPRFVANPPNPPKKQTKIETPLVVTYATREFLPSLSQWLASFDAQRAMIPNLEALVYLGHDVPESTRTILSDSYKFIRFASLPTEAPENFKDIWDGKHYAWKIYIYQELANKENRMIFYLDAGGFMCRWPTEYLLKAQENDVCVLEDEQQFNEQWCSDKSKEIMKITQSELNINQIVGGIMAFRAGSEKAKAYFNEAWSYAQNRDCIVGEKWEGVCNGKPFGHRHDQSILSILSIRHKLAKYPLHNIYCDTSLRRTFLTNKNIYVHRGMFKIHEKFLTGIDECFVINLKRRKDRLERLYTSSPEFKNKIIEFEAVEGRNLQLTQSIARLFRPHDFMWKKAIMGCALSHLDLWYKLASEKPDIDNYLILEDDVKFQPEWQARWREAQPYIPENYDIIYLGGVLPPNRAGFEVTKDPVNKYFSRVKENNFFGQQQENRYFHFCAYAYVLTKQGAQKIMALIQAKDGYYTSADHMLCNPVDFLNIYFLDPLVAGCYQDDDPVYKSSEFNNFNRVDGFDSDLWNNDERFDRVEAELLASSGELHPGKALQDARNYVAPEPVVVKPTFEKIVTRDSNILNKICCLETQDIEWSKLYEHSWLHELFGRPKIVELQKVKLDERPPVERPILLVQKGHFENYHKLFSYYECNEIPYYILHLSDEHENDDISFYDNKNCLGVIRNYVRSGLNSKVNVIPLGYHFTIREGIDNPFERTPQLPFRSNVWCFFGTNWNGRQAIINLLEPIEKNTYKLFDSWNDPNNLGREEYCATLLDSVFVPCMGGQNSETFRLYEALECGCIPIIINDEANANYFKYINQYLPFLNINSWSQVPTLITQLMKDKQSLETYRFILLNNYKQLKENLKKDLERYKE
jgi:GR25 family glycosyltransferase involved in LPS biosynthesis